MRGEDRRTGALFSYVDLEIEFDRHHGDEAILKAERATSSAAC